MPSTFKVGGIFHALIYFYALRKILSHPTAENLPEANSMSNRHALNIASPSPSSYLAGIFCTKRVSTFSVFMPMTEREGPVMPRSVM